MKNRFISRVLVLIMAFYMICCPVSAINDTDVSVDEYKLNGMEVLIKGITGPETSVYLTVVIIGKDMTDPLNPGTSEYRYVGTLKSIASGEFGDLDINLNYEQSNEPKKYAISVYLDSMEAVAPKIIELTYCNEAKLNEMIDDAVKYKSDPSDQIGQNVVAYMAGSADKQVFEDSGVWLSEYDAMEQEVKDAVNSAVGKAYHDLTAATLKEIVNGSIIACSIENDDTEEILNKLKKYEEELFVPEDESTWVFGIKGKEKEDGSSPTIALKHLDGAAQSWVAENVKDNANNSQTSFIATYDGIQKAVKQGMLLSIVNTENYSYLENLLKENTDILDGDWSAFTSLKKQEQINAVMQDIKVDNNRPVEYKTVDELLNAVNVAVADFSKDKGNSHNGGNGGNGGNKGASFPTIDRGVQITDTQSTKGRFVDMSGFEWATEAVESLQNKGILNGVGDGRFEPGRAITREEFVKLICEAFGFGKSTGNVPFTDVVSNGWYAPYISKAYELGIINGISESTFGVGAVLTREDMAVITCRAIEYAGVTLNYTANDFADTNMISDYALNSVSALANAGVVKGVGDGRFMPKNNGSRAEVAVILYRCINEFKIGGLI